MGAKLVTVSTDTEFVHLAWKRDEKELADVRYTCLLYTSDAADDAMNV